MSLADKHIETPRIRPREYIKIRGANEHNLKNIDVDIPRNELVVLTGLSGSGKSSLAFDTIYAEGQRRSPQTEIPDLQWELLQRFMIISDCCMQG